ncbi:GAF domain-containing protein [Thermoflavimicrobium dichotomicum]|uniref:GAF domain-containing protein n=1 Tax=Thermoflavimicrobium dichotomicum TaxID=46223 RepID=A0A1I3P134_9BACL|nr:GAF domain-containing protein [Thermoflavimicrobium dichotomicum]SFJ15141.1 GAF domain-containing protein [Thermoflavimicrobium dichotomicum]
MDFSGILEFFEQLEASGGWFYDFLSYFVAVGLVFLFIIYLLRLWRGEINWLGQKIEDPNIPELSLKEREELESQISKLIQENELLLKQVNKKDRMIQKLNKEINEIKKLYIELDEKYADETYTMSQIMYTAEEVAAALVDEENFLVNKDDIYDNVLDYLINTLRDYREKNPRIVIHIPHPEKEDVLVHYAHSGGHSHRIKEYEPPIYGSAAGRAWRNNEVYYIPDVEDSQAEYDRKMNSSKQYRSILSVPLSIGQDKSTCIGVLSLTGKPVDAYEKIEIERVVLFSKLLYPLILMDINRKGVIQDGFGSEKSKT